MQSRQNKANRIVIVILAAVVLAVGAAALFLNLNQAPATATREVRVYRAGKLYATGHLGQAEEIVVRGDDGEENIVAFTENGVYMKSATCHNQLCIGQGEVTLDNVSTRFYRNEIICLPNRVTVELVLTDEEAAELPDV